MKILASLVFMSFILFSCSDDDPTVLPECIDEELQAFIPAACSGTSDLTLWRFRGQDVYCFAYGNCIQPTYAEIFDQNCVSLCILGGANNNNDCDGTPWDVNAERLELLYQN